MTDKEKHADKIQALIKIRLERYGKQEKITHSDLQDLIDGLDEYLWDLQQIEKGT